MIARNGKKARFVVCGAGLGGALMAIYLGRAGHDVAVYERRGDPRAKGFIGGRSINLALSARGIAALNEVGVAAQALADAVAMPGRMMHSPESELTYQAYSKDPAEAINSVSRGGLNLLLLETADRLSNVSMFFGQRCVDVDFDRTAAVFEDEQTGEQTPVEADVIIGADGAFSAVRTAMLKTDRFNYSQSYLEHGYKELSIPAREDGGFALEPHALHIWPRGGSMMIALPNKDGSFTCTLFWPYRGPHSFESIRSDTDILPFFEKHYPDAVAIMPTLVEDFRENPISSLVTIRCRPWSRGNVALLGDACHAIVPFYGQGMNAAFEDCAALNRRLGECGGDWRAAIEQYEQERKEHADAIADMALDNFIEMRDKVGSRVFLAKKKGEKILHSMFPEMFKPLYNMISFSTIPYAEARRRARHQGRIVRAVAAFVGLSLLLALLLGLMP